jgi:hypothetical protein
VTLGALDHQVHVQVGAEAAQRLAGLRAHGDRWDEVAVHDVHVHHVRAGGHDLLHLLAQAAEVGRQYRGGDAPPHTSTSIDPPQWLHAVVAVLDMRTIVECSPQSGQTERSSKRCRQNTQR